MPGFTQVVFLKNVIRRPNIEVGDYSYYDDPNGAERFEEHNVLYHFEFIGDRLIIGRFVAISAAGRVGAALYGDIRCKLSRRHLSGCWSSSLASA